MPELLLGWWATGLVDGEGCFYAGLQFRTRPSAKKLVDCVEFQASLQVALRADDAEVLHKLRDVFGCGLVRPKKFSRYSPSRVRQGQKDPKPQKVFIVRHPDDLLTKVIPHFEAFPLQSKKSTDFEVWSQIVSFAACNLLGRKGWLRRFPSEVQTLGEMCVGLKTSREFAVN